MTDLSPLVPALAVELGRTPGSHWTSVDGSMLSADISGFTALSERLAGKGKAGAEEITELINACFTALIDAATEYGGDVLKFGGDAVLVFFRGADHLVRAGIAALAMQHALSASSAARQAHLTMTVGVGEGPFDVFLVGEPRRELLICGANGSEVIHLESSCERGGTLMSPAIAEAMSSRLTSVDGGGLILHPSEPQEPYDLGEELEAYIPGSVLAQLDAFSGTGGEHRLVTVGFVMVSGVDELIAKEGGRAVCRHLTELVNAVRDAGLRYRVTFLHSDIAPSGAKLILAAGAPLTSGSDEDAMLHATLAIAAIETPLTIKVGAHRGRVFAGFLGASQRSSYTVMGDPVNTAARLLGQAGRGEVIATTELFKATDTVFEGVELEPFMVKGKSEPLAAHRVVVATDDVRRTGAESPLIGRDSELSKVLSLLTQGASSVELSGPAGIGKTHLVLAALQLLPSDTRVFRTGCSNYGSSEPYSAFRPFLRRAFGYDVNLSPERIGERLTKTVTARAPELVPLLPLLAVAFGAQVASTPEADAVAPEFRRARIHDCVIDLFDASIDDAAVLLVEDVHWIDDASSELLTRIVRAAATRDWADVVTRRTESDWKIDAGQPHCHAMPLPPLADEDVRTLVIATSEIPLSDAQVDAIVTRAGGSPLFAAELTRGLGQGGVTTLPESIEGLIATRVDGLSPNARLALRIASVFGREFSLEEIAAVGGNVESFDDDLSELIDLNADGTYRFAQAVYRDAIYEGLPFRSRKRLHREVGEYLEGRAENPSEIASLLSIHFAEAQKWSAAWKYSQIAGDQAAAQYAHSEAAAAYRRALHAASRYRSADPAERRRVVERLGDSLMIIGEYEEAFSAFGKARRDATALQGIDLMRRQGMVRDRQGSIDAAIRWYERCLKKLPKENGDRAEREARLHVSLAYAAARHRQGKFTACLDWAKRAEVDAIDLGDKASQAKALDRLHVAATYLKLPEAESYGPAALALHQELGDHLSQARILDNMGIQAYFAYRWDEALEFYESASDAGRIAGDVIEANLGRMNAAEVFSDRGVYDKALSEFSDVLRNWSAAGWSFGMAGARSNIALANGRAGNVYAEPYEELLATEKEFEALGAEEFVGEGLVRLCEVAAHLGNYAGCLTDGERAIEAVADPQSKARVLRYVAIAHLGLGSPELACSSIRKSIELAEACGAQYELGMSHQIAAVLAGMDDPAHAEISRTLLTELGVVQLPAAFAQIGITEVGANQPSVS